MSETNIEQDTEFFNVEKQRRRLFQLLSHVLETSKDKFDKDKASNVDRQKWARLIIGGVQAYGELLKTFELENIENRLERLEQGEKFNKVFNPSVKT